MCFPCQSRCSHNAKGHVPSSIAASSTSPICSQSLTLGVRVSSIFLKEGHFLQITNHAFHSLGVDHVKKIFLRAMVAAKV